MRPYYLCNHLQVFTFNERGFPNIPPSCTASCCSWMKNKAKSMPIQGVFTKDPIAGGRSGCWWPWVGVTVARDRGKASCLWKTPFNSQDRQVHWKKNGEKIPSWGQTWSWLQGWVWFSLVSWHRFFWTQFSLGRPCKLFPRTPQWGSCGEFAAHGVQLVTELTRHFYSLRRIRMC